MDLFGIPGDLVGLILGWLLGLFTPIIAGRFQRERDRRELVAAIRAELGELRITMAMVAHEFQERLGPLDDEFLDWLIVALTEYPGGDPELPKYVSALQAFRALPLSARPRRPRVASEATLLQQYRLPFLEANLTRLGICSIPFQQGVINVKRTLDNFNGDTTSMLGYFEKTFDSSIGPNYKVVQANLDRAYPKALRTAKHLVDQVGRLLANGT